jgi:hypothetical protein
MKIQENYLYLLDGTKEVKVIWKKLDKVCIMEIGKEYPSAIVDEDRLSGIPITEERLLMFGFEKIGGTIYKNIGSIEIGLIGKRFYIQIRSENRTIQNIHHIHQLQILFFALTNQEL